jgi:hypothetical protein
VSGYNLDGYIDVPNRIKLFLKRYPEGSLQMEPPEFREIEGKMWAIGRAYAYRTPDDIRPGIGTAWEIVPGTTPFTRGSELQNLETSCWGRSIGALGIGIDASIATLDEIQHAKERQKVIATSEPTPANDPFYTTPANYTGKADIIYNPNEAATAKQIGMIKGLLKEAGAESSDAGLGMINDYKGSSITSYDQLTKGEASALIKHYKNPP